MNEEINHVRLVIDLRFEGDYYHSSELVEVASGWLDSALTDRDDLQEWKISGTVLPTCAHCGEAIEGDGHTWAGPIPEPGQPQLKYHLSREFPDCRRASGACGSGLPRHLGGNAEDCPACDITKLAYPFICPGEEQNGS